MWWSVAIDVLAGILLVAVWYYVFVQMNRKRSAWILAWIDAAFSGYGHVAGVQWVTPSRFQVRLRLTNCGFKHPTIMVQLAPRERPLQWFINKLRKKPETLTFEANLHCPPSFNLDVQNHRWCGRTRRNLPRNPQGWKLESIGPFVISSRHNWQREITNMMNSVMASRSCNFLNVSFRRSSPHFSATVPLDSLESTQSAGGSVFEVLRELAAGASASRF